MTVTVAITDPEPATLQIAENCGFVIAVCLTVTIKRPIKVIGGSKSIFPDFDNETAFHPDGNWLKGYSFIVFGPSTLYTQLLFSDPTDAVAYMLKHQSSES